MDLGRARERYGDRVLVTALAVTYVVELVRWDGGPLALAVAVATGGCLVLLLRKRQPVLAFVLVMVANLLVDRVAPGFSDEAISFPIVMLVAVYSLGRWAIGIQAWLGFGVLLVCIAGFVMSDGGHDASDVAFGIAFVGTPWGVGAVLRRRRDREDQLEADAQQLRRNQEDTARRAVTAERARIARELHDVVSHAISVTVLQARGGRRLLGVDDGAVRRALDAIEHTNTAALGDMRRLLAVLRDTEDCEDSGLSPQPSLSRLQELVEHVRSSGLRVDMEVCGEASAVPPGVDLSAYRIVQEALTNVLKHAGTMAHAGVHISYRPDGVDVSVRDDGCARPSHGDEEQHSGGQGLINIRERVAVVGGTVEAGPRPKGGFHVTAHLPYSMRPGGIG
jgi:signal transduction histidine kinase